MKFLTSFRAKFIVLQIILLSALAALHVEGLLTKPFHGEAGIFAAGVCVIALWALVHVWRNNIFSAEWYAEKLVRIGIIGLQIGILVALGAMAERLVTGGDMMQVTGLFLNAMSGGLYVSVIALASNLWIEFTIKVID